MKNIPFVEERLKECPECGSDFSGLVQSIDSMPPILIRSCSSCDYSEKYQQGQ